MNFSWSRFYAILKKELIQLKRDRATAMMVVLIPIIQLLLFGYAINNDPKFLSATVLSRDNSILTRNIITGLRNSEYFNIEKEISSDEDGKNLLQRGETQFVITIPENFSKDLVRGNKPSILIEADATDPITTSGAVGAINEILKSALLRDLKGPLSRLKNADSPVDVLLHRLYNPEGFTRYNIIPGLIGVLLTLTGIMVTALSLTRERERGTMENMLAMPVKPIEIMAGKIVPYVLIGYIQAAVIIFFAYFLFEVPLLGSGFLLALVLFIFIVCNLSLGFTISTMVRNQMQSIQMTMIVFLPSMMLSGFLFPFKGMPMWAQAIGNCVPMTYFIRIIRGIALKGSSFAEIWPNFWPLLLFMIITKTIAIKLYKKTLD